MCVAALAAIPAWVGPAMTAVSTVVGAVGAISSGQQQAAIARAQAQQAEQQAKDALQQGREEEQNFRLKTNMGKSQKIADMAANGLDTSSGSALNVAGDIASLGETDALRIRRNAYTTANAYGTQAGIYKQSANNLASSGLLSAGGTILSGMGNVASDWYKLKAAGAV